MLSQYLTSVQDPIDDNPELGEFLLHCLQFMSSLANVAETLSARHESNEAKKASGSLNTTPSDPTYLLLAYEVTDLAGLVSLLYGMLLHQGAPSRPSLTSSTPALAPPALPSHTLSVSKAACQLAYHLVRQHLAMVQDVLAQEGISLEFRHIASYLLWYCQCHQEEKELLHLAIILVGYFAAKHQDNQVRRF